MIDNTDAAIALVPHNGQGTTTEVLHILKRVVSQCSEKIYITENVSLLLWIYYNNDIKEILLEEWFHIQLDDAQVQDVGKKQRPAIRDDCKVALDAVNQASKSSPLSLRCLLSTSSPIILQQEEN